MNSKFYPKGFTSELVATIQDDLLRMSAECSAPTITEYLSRNWRMPDPIKPRKTIAIVLSHRYNYWEQAAFQKMRVSLEVAHAEQYDFEYQFFSGENSRTFLNHYTLGEMRGSSHAFDAIVAFCPWTASLTKAAISSFDKRVHLFFAGVSCPEKAGLIRADERSDDMVSGVIMGTPSYDKQARTITDLKPDAYTLLVPYDRKLTLGGATELHYGPTAGLIDAWKERGGVVEMLPITAFDDIGSKIVERADDETVVNFSTQSSMIAQAPHIVQACNGHGVTLYAHDRLSVRRGVGFGSGWSGSEYGSTLAALMSEVMINGAAPQTVKFAHIIESPDVCYHEQALKKQGITLSKQMTRLMQMIPISCVE